MDNLSINTSFFERQVISETMYYVFLFFVVKGQDVINSAQMKEIIR
jgi:hypothetical protein